MLKKIVLVLSLFSALIFCGCATQQSLKPGPEDYKDAALKCLNQMYQDGVLDELEEVPMMKVSRVLNRTSYMIQTGWITDMIVSDLNRSGKIKAMTEDAYMRQKQAWEASMNSDDGLDVAPTFADVTLSGKIYEESSRVGRSVEKTYMFRLELNKDGLILGGPWIHEVKKSSSF